MLAIWNLWRAATIAQQLTLLEQIGAAFEPRLRLIMAVVWALVFAALAAGVWRRHARARTFLPLLVLLYGGYELLLFLFMPTATARQGWPLHLLTLLLAVAWTGWVSFGSTHRNVWKHNDENG